MLLERLYNRYAKKPLRLYWWQYEPPHKKNFGDEITPYLINKLWNRRCIWTPPDKCELVGAGSLIEILQRNSKGNHIKVWGSGFIQAGPPNSHSNLEFYAVRGRLSRERVKFDEKIALGDPGLLLSIANPGLSKLPKKYRVGVIPHYVDQENTFIQKSKGAGFKIINVLDTPYEVAKQINQCEIILSSSLHGLIVSESFGVPNYWVELSSKVTGNGYKFRDYGSSIGRKLEPHNPEVISDQLSAGELINSYAPSPKLEEIQKNLIKCFPFR